ncbi:MAG: Phosphopantetheine attachment site, partial [Candidatus Kentron sp. G]
MVLAFAQGEIPPHINLKEFNPHIPIADTFFSVPREPTPWRNEHKLAGVSSFGMSGTNAHVVLEEAPDDGWLGSSEASPQSVRPWHLLALSAKSDAALRELAGSYGDYLKDHPDIPLADICFTAATGRAHFEYRLALVAGSLSDARGRLEAADYTVGESARERPKIAFLFTGQGSQYVGMGRRLYETQPLFREILDRCDAILRTHDVPLLDLLYSETAESAALQGGISNAETFSLDQTIHTQPALFSLEYALAMLWQSWGVAPDAVMGHSVGEYVAACIAGVFGLEDGLKLIAARGRLMQTLCEPGDMLALPVGEREALELIAPLNDKSPDELSIAAINGPASVVVSGKPEAMETLKAGLAEKGIEAKPLSVSHAFHSAMMEPMLAEFEKVTASITYAPPKIPVCSNVTGEMATGELTDPAYWVRHVREPVRFAAGVKTLHAEGIGAFLEIGPKPALLGMAGQCLPEDAAGGAQAIFIPSLREGRDDWRQLFGSLGQWYVQGGSVDWAAFDKDYTRRKVQLPTYPFQRQRYWIDDTENRERKASALPEGSLFSLLELGHTERLVEKLEQTGQLSEKAPEYLPEILEVLASEYRKETTADAIKDWFYEIEWQSWPCSSITGIQSRGSWLIFADQGGMGEELAGRLEKQGGYCILAYANDFTARNHSTWHIDPAEPADFRRLFVDAFPEESPPLAGIVHLWALDAPDNAELTAEKLTEAQTLTCSSVLHLLQSFAARNHVTPLRGTRLWLVTRNAVSVEQTEDSLSIAQAPLWGMGKVIAMEHPDLWGGLIDSPEPGDILAEIDAGDEEDQVAYRDGRRYAPRLIKSEMVISTDARAPLTAEGSYLITGGLGALGLVVARWMVDAGARNLILTGRRAPSEQVRKTIEQLEETGSKVLVVGTDVSERGQVVRLFEEIDQQMPQLRGIIHAAGVMDSEVLVGQDRSRFRQGMAAKVEGSWHLHTLTRTMPLDFFVCFSSSSTLLGGRSMGSYVAANTFMDALVYFRRSLGLPGLAIDWGPWADEGMGTEFVRGGSLDPKEYAISAERGTHILGVLMGNPDPVRIGVMPGDLSSYLQLAYPGRIPPFLEGYRTTGTSSGPTDFMGRFTRLPPEKRQSYLLDHIQSELNRVLGFDPGQPMDPKKGFTDQGMDSLMIVESRNRLQTSIGYPLPPILLFDFPNLSALADYITREISSSVPDADSTLDAVPGAEAAVSGNEPIAIIGMGCRFPEADNPEAYWRLLRDGVDAVTEIPSGRWDINAFYDPDPDAPGKIYTRRGSFLSGIDGFDPRFFGISPREATDMDPQQRLLLEVAWEALENAAQPPDELQGSPVGVFVGITQMEYGSLTLSGAHESFTPYTWTGASLGFSAGRLSYVLGLQGPSLALDTACSSSLVAIDSACQSLRTGKCQLAIAGGVNLNLSPEIMVFLSQTKALAPDGRCKTFDASADGYARGEGCGILILKRLSEAVADKDNILAVIRGSATKHDGVSSGFTVPNRLSQEKVIREALGNARVTPADISYVEAHGTGTSLGDPIEVGALGSVFAENHSNDSPLTIGSAKTNLGHLEAAAGMAGLMKVVLALQHQEIPAHLHFKEPNPYIDWENLPFRVPVERQPWPRGQGEERMPRIAGVSSFGMSGTNAHVVLEEAPDDGWLGSSEASPQEASPQSVRPWHLLALSAKSEEALRELAHNYAIWLETHPETPFADVCFTANTGRSHFEHRLALVAGSSTDAEEKLRAADYVSGEAARERPKIAFLFTGQGSEYPGMGRGFYETQPLFRETLEACDTILRPLNVPLLDLLYPDIANPDKTPQIVLSDDMTYLQPVLFALEYALARVWQSWGVQPDVVMGHSIGEYVAACVAGVFSLEDALQLVANRGRLMQTCPEGRMLAVAVSEARAREIIAPFGDAVSVATINAPESVVLSGK